MGTCWWHHPAVSIGVTTQLIALLKAPSPRNLTILYRPDKTARSSEVMRANEFKTAPDSPHYMHRAVLRPRWVTRSVHSGTGRRGGGRGGGARRHVFIAGAWAAYLVQQQQQQQQPPRERHHADQSALGGARLHAQSSSARAHSTCGSRQHGTGISTRHFIHSLPAMTETAAAPIIRASGMASYSVVASKPARALLQTPNSKHVAAEGKRKKTSARQRGQCHWAAASPVRFGSK